MNKNNNFDIYRRKNADPHLEPRSTFGSFTLPPLMRNLKQLLKKLE